MTVVKETESQVVGTRASADKELEVLENSARGRFELRSSGELVSFADFQEADGVVTIPHVETPAEHRGQGHAGRLMAGVLEILTTEQRRVRPVCPYAARYVKERPEHHHLLAGPD